MKPKFILTAAAFLLSVSFFSQTIDVTVHFPKGSDVIEDESLSQLKIWAMENHHKRHEPLILRGHTDRDADDEYNMKLSQRRNGAVHHFLEQAGYDHIQFTSHGESWPLCSSDDENCMHGNRRVEVLLFDLPEEKFMLGSADESPQIRFVEPTKKTALTGLLGTKITVPENAFLTKDGLPVTGNVRIELKEYYNLRDCIMNKLSTTCNQQLLESGGMIYVQAFSGEEELRLAPGITLDILFASQANGPEEGMEIFAGNFQNGQINWTNFPNAGKDGSIRLARKEKEKVYTTKRKQSDTNKREILLGGRTIEVTYGKNQPTIANYRTSESNRSPLNEYERGVILNYINGTGIMKPSITPTFPFQTSGLGWINCDRFVNAPVVVSQFVKTEIIADATYLLVFEGINSIVLGTIGTEGKVFFPNVPPGRKVTLICYQEGEEDLNVFGIKSFTISKDEESFETQILTTAEVKRQLDIFNKFI